jgi:UDPglucose 6-dehydrogenase
VLCLGGGELVYSSMQAIKAVEVASIQMRPKAVQHISIVGLGYVGLSTAVCLASRGFAVIGIDVDKNRVKALQNGKSPIHEQGLDPLLRSSLRKKTLTVRSNYEGLARSKTIFITVGTPSKPDGGIDSEFVEAASKDVGRQLASARGYHLVVVKSTVTPGTTEGLVRRILERESGKKAGVDFGLASNPEFLHEGSAIRETFHPDAVVIGGFDRRSKNTLVKVYDSFYGKRPSTILTSPSNAEMMKYAINAGRAVQLSFVNTVANLCSRIPGCDYDEVRKGLEVVARMDPRYLVAGLGFGGSCLPKDCRALGANLRSAAAGDEMIAAALSVNEGQVKEAVKLAEKLGGSLDGKRVAILGLAFKAGTDDLRESVAIALARALVKMGAEITVYDPVAMENAKRLLGSQVAYAKTARDCINGSECAFVATGWEDFKRLGPGDFKELMAKPIVVDGRRIYDQERFFRAGVGIATIGTGPRIEGSTSSGGSKGNKEWHYVFGKTVAHPSDSQV